MIIFHLLTEGRAYAHVEGNDRSLPLNAGDILIVPHGDPHILETARPSRRWTAHKWWNEFYLKVSKYPAWAEGGEITKFVCGYMSCDPHLSGVFLGGLPAIMRVNIRDDTSGQWFENSIRYSVDHADAPRPGGGEENGVRNLFATRGGRSLFSLSIRSSFSIASTFSP